MSKERTAGKDPATVCKSDIDEERVEASFANAGWARKGGKGLLSFSKDLDPDLIAQASEFYRRGLRSKIGQVS